MTLVWIILGIIACLALSAFFSASEMAYSSCNSVRLENMSEDGSKRAGVALKITERFNDALSAILIGNNLVNIAASSLASVLVILLTNSDRYTWLSTLLLSILVIVFGETIPKITAKKNANRVSLRNAYIIRGLMIILFPLIWIVVLLVRLFTFWMKADEEEAPEEAVEELQSIIETAEDEAVLDEDQSELVQAAIDFSDISASEVMTARVDVQAIDIDDDWDEILQQIEEAPFSRLPVYENSIDNIIGVLYLNHFLKALTDDGRVDIRKLLMKPCFVYKTMKLPAVLQELRKARQHMAVVADEYGGVLGVVTMEDVLETIVGDIWDETDIVEEEVVQRPSGAYELDGDMTIDDFRELLEIPEDALEADSETVGGWTVETFGTFPDPGTVFQSSGLTVTVLQMDGRRVEKILVEKTPADKEGSAEDEKI
ncbi:MAG: HlyC/CorC family transporter [Oscillospiraceae bacterium]|jgi:CBS domain containing-hemolysin-like protein|nr:HlyC/CorC family transporter [Oscillospiraceae bacterium]